MFKSMNAAGLNSRESVIGFFKECSIVPQGYELCPEIGNRLAPYYVGLFSTPYGNTSTYGVILKYFHLFSGRSQLESVCC